MKALGFKGEICRQKRVRPKDNRLWVIYVYLETEAK